MLCVFCFTQHAGQAEQAAVLRSKTKELIFNLKVNRNGLLCFLLKSLFLLFILSFIRKTKEIRAAKHSFARSLFLKKRWLILSYQDTRDTSKENRLAKRSFATLYNSSTLFEIQEI